MVVQEKNERFDFCSQKYDVQCSFVLLSMMMMMMMMMTNDLVHDLMSMNSINDFLNAIHQIYVRKDKLMFLQMCEQQD